MYDQYGHAAFDGSMGADGAYGNGSASGGGTYRYAGPDGTFHEYHFEGNGDMDDFLKQMFIWLPDFLSHGSEIKEKLFVPICSRIQKSITVSTAKNIISTLRDVAFTHRDIRLL